MWKSVFFLSGLLFSGFYLRSTLYPHQAARIIPENQTQKRLADKNWRHTEAKKGVEKPKDADLPSKPKMEPPPPPVNKEKQTPVEQNKAALSPVSVPNMYTAQHDPSGDLFHYDAAQDAYIVHETLANPKAPFYSDDFLELLNIVDQNSDLASAHYLSREYSEAYARLEETYSDIYIWPFLTTNTSRLNFFAFLLKKYSDNNSSWRPYEKDKADCTQFSERAYFFMYPGEMVIKDPDYFDYLFSDQETVLERTKQINKIPGLYYLSVRPYLLKANVRGGAPKKIPGHAMVGLSLKGGIGDLIGNIWIAGEPQNGNIASIDELRRILPGSLKQESVILRMGKILGVPSDPKKEPRISDELIGYLPEAGISNEMVIMTPESVTMLIFFKQYLEKESAKTVVMRQYIEFLGKELQQGEESRETLLDFQESTVSMLNVLGNELNSRLGRSRSEEIMMKFSESLVHEARMQGYVNDDSPVIAYLDQFKFLAISRFSDF